MKHFLIRCTHYSYIRPSQFLFIVPSTTVAKVPSGSILPIMIATTFALVAGSAIMVFAFTDVSNTARDNIFSFLVDAPETPFGSPVGFAEAAILPLDVKETFRTIEKTGDAKNSPSRLDIEAEFVDPDEHCEYCYRIAFKSDGTGKAGAILKANKPINLEEAKSLIMFARGDNGEENVQFSVAGKELDVPSKSENIKELKFAYNSANIKLNKEWQKYEIDLSNADLSDITHALGFEIGESDLKDSGNIIVIYLKGITFDTRTATQSLPASDTSQ